ncbi:MAG: hypothetical protein R2856_11975 [Caldilineaceae bacterium]
MAFNIRYSSFVTPALFALLGIASLRLGRLWLAAPAGLAPLLVGLVLAVRADLTDPRLRGHCRAGRLAARRDRFR